MPYPAKTSFPDIPVEDPAEEKTAPASEAAPAVTTSASWAFAGLGWTLWIALGLIREPREPFAVFLWCLGLATAGLTGSQWGLVFDARVADRIRRELRRERIWSNAAARAALPDQLMAVPPPIPYDPNRVQVQPPKPESTADVVSQTHPPAASQPDLGLGPVPVQTSEIPSEPVTVSPTREVAEDLLGLLPSTDQAHRNGSAAKSPPAAESALAQPEGLAALRLTSETPSPSPAPTPLPPAPKGRDLWDVAKYRAAIASARKVKDALLVLELREELIPLLGPTEREELDQDLARWFLRWFQYKLRTGIMSVELAQFAAQVADIFIVYAEGASLRAALPTLRRSARLCPRCALPYEGVEDACPDCLTKRYLQQHPSQPPPLPDADADGSAAATETRLSSSPEPETDSNPNSDPDPSLFTDPFLEPEPESEKGRRPDHPD